MKPLAWEATPPPRDDRSRLPVNFPRVFRTVSTSAPDPEVRLLPPLYARVLLEVAMPSPYPETGGVS